MGPTEADEFKEEEIRTSPPPTAKWGNIIVSKRDGHRSGICKRCNTRARISKFCTNCGAKMAAY